MADPSQVPAVPSLLSHRHLVRFLSTMRPYSCDMRARGFLFPTIPTRRTLSVTIVTSLVFIFFMSHIPLIVFFAGLQNWRSAETATRRRCSPRKYDSARTCILVDPRSVRKRGQYAVSVRKRAHHPRPARVDGRSQIAFEADIQPAGDWAASDSFLTP